MEDQPGDREESCMTSKSYDIPKTMICEAWLRVKANKGAAGIDAETIGRFETKLGANLYKLWNRMSSGSYFPPPVKAVPIPKKSGGVRVLGIPTRAVQRSLLNIIANIDSGPPRAAAKRS
jgi:retron-type reverse transcriptase